MPQPAQDTRKWWILGAMGAILGVILLDETVVGVALPTIQTDLDMSEVTSHWVVNIYMLVLAGLAAGAGKLGDVVGHKAVMVTGLAVFGLASTACGFAASDVWLVAARGVQGVGAAIIFPSSLAMVTIAFPERQRGLALGIYGSVGTVFLALGPTVGGLLTDVASWRWIFWVNPPIVVLIAAIVLAKWRDPPVDAPAGRFDRAGLILLVGGLSAVVLATMEGPGWGWADPATLGLLFGGAALLVAFVLVERRTADPLIEVDLFRSPTFSGSNLVIFLAQYSKMPMFVFGAMYLQDVLGFDALQAGLALLPTVAPQVFAAPLAGLAADRYGARMPSIIGVAAMTLAIVWVAATLGTQSYMLLFPGLLLWGLTPAFLFVAPQRAVMTAVPAGKQGQAGGIAMSAQLLGATVGMALSSTVFSMTSSFAAVFWSNAALSAVVLGIAWLTIDRHPGGAAHARQ